MTFLEPLRLLGLVIVALLLLAYVVQALRRRSYALRFTNVDLLSSLAPKRPGWRRHVPAAVYLVALVALVAAFARPAHDEEVARERATVVLAIDTSLSMEADDVAPTRLAAAQAAAQTFLDSAPAGINVGLVTFNGVATLRVPPTNDRDAVRAAVDQLQLGEATAIGEAILTSLDALSQVPADEEGTPPPARIVVLSDGTTTVGRPDEVGVAAANEAGVPVSTIAFGTDTGSIPNPEGPGIVYVPVDRPALEAIAAETGGSFYEAASAEQLTDVYEDIGSSVGYVTELQEISTWFVAGALFLLTLGGVLSLVWFSRLP
jgi:Ca-activated chloride channel family protein